MTYLRDRIYRRVLNLELAATRDDPVIPFNFKGSAITRAEVDCLAAFFGVTRTKVLIDLVEGALPEACNVVRQSGIKLNGKTFDESLDEFRALALSLNDQEQAA